MKLTDLKIGNLFEYNTIFCHVMAIDSQRNTATFGYFSNSVGFIRNPDIGFPKPIPLTEQILTELGCIPNAYDKFFWRTPNNYLFTFRKKDGVCPIQIGGGQNVIELKYVHDLQNVIALTGEHLTLKT